MSETESTLVSIPEIASIAGVTRAAVGNWRKRHPDFPVPAVTAPSGALFDINEVEAWLVENGKIRTRIPASARLWPLVDLANTRWKPDETLAFLASALVYLEACQPERHRAPRAKIPHGTTWSEVKHAKHTLRALQHAFVALENANTDLRGLLTDGLAHIHERDDRLVCNLLNGLEASSDEPRFALFEQAVDRLVSRDRFWEQHSTPGDLATLIASLADVHEGTVLDLAAGEGGLLLMTVVIAPDDATNVTLLGFERNPEIARLAGCRIYLYDVAGVDARVVQADSLRLDIAKIPHADVVVLDPPLGLRNWGDAETYLDDRWRYGHPSPKSADFAWLQLAALALRTGGHAYVLLPATSLTRTGRDGDTRAKMLDAGVVEAVILLPERMRADTSIPLALWVLRSPDTIAPANEVLLVDASDLGEHGRGRAGLPEETIDLLHETLSSWRNHQPFPPGVSGHAFPVPVDELDGARLDPRVHRPAPTTDLDALLHRIAELSEQLNLQLPLDALDRLEPTSAGISVRTARLGDLVRIERGSAVDTTDDPSAGPPVVGASEIAGRVQRYSTVTHTAAPDRSKRPVHLDEGDIVLTMVRDGRSLLIDPDRFGSILGPDCAALRVTAPKGVLPEWLHLWMHSSDFQQQYQRQLTGTTIPRLSAGALRDFVVPLPSIEAQRQAVEQLQSLDDEIIATRQKLSHLEELRQVQTDVVTALAERGGT